MLRSLWLWLQPAGAPRAEGHTRPPLGLKGALAQEGADPQSATGAAKPLTWRLSPVRTVEACAPCLQLALVPGEPWEPVGTRRHLLLWVQEQVPTPLRGTSSSVPTGRESQLSPSGPVAQAALPIPALSSGP